MDVISAPGASAKPEEDRPAGSSLRLLWQVPVFFVGVVALITVCLARGYVKPDPVRHLHHDLAEARRLLHRHGGDPEGARTHAQQAVEDLGYDPDRSAEAFFLLGSAHVRIADATNEADDGEHWREARRCLEEADRLNLSGDDAGRLHYLLAKVGFHTNDDPNRVIALLKANKDQADERAEALSMLCQAYLRLNPPNVKEALKTNMELREKVPQIGEDVLGPAKLAGAKLLLRLGQREDARKTLEKISEQAPSAVLAESRRLLATLYQEEQKWPAAAELWKTVLNDKHVQPTELGGVLYNLGVCYGHLDQSDRAAEAWTDCLRRTHGPEAQAAALALAELRLHEANSDKAIEMLAESVAKVRKADDWKNEFMDLSRVRDLFERAVQTFRQAHRFDRAVQAAELYERVAVAPQAQILRADLSSEWARSRRDKAKQSRDAATRKKEEATACELFRQAAEAHDEAARSADKDEHLWLSAVCSYDGQDYARAVEKLTKLLEKDMDNVDRQGEGWYLLGESQRNLRRVDAAEAAYKNCLANNARFTCRARYQLAMIDMEAGRIDQAAQELEQNLKIEHHEPDQEAQDKSRLALCSLLYHGGSKMPQNFRHVVEKLEGTIDRFPLSPEAVRARFQLADSYRQLAAQRTVNRFMSGPISPDAHQHFLEQNQRAMNRAAEEFAKLEELIDDPELSSLLTDKQRREVPFIVAQCRFNLGEYDKALKKYEELAKRWGNRPEAIWALSGTVQCFGSLGDFDKLRRQTEQIPRPGEHGRGSDRSG